MLPYLHILIRVEDDGSLHALGAFTSKEKLQAYQKATGLPDDKVRLDFFNGPFDEDLKVIYAGHRHWNMASFQLGGYFKSEGEAWNEVTQEGYVRVLQIDISFEQEKAFEQEVLEHYAKLQKRWRLASYDELVASEGAEKARANLMLRFYEDTLESFKPKNQRDLRALYALLVVFLVMPFATLFFLNQSIEYGENLPTVDWLPNTAKDVSFYRSPEIKVFEFKIDPTDFKRWAESIGMTVTRQVTPQVLSRYRAYIPSSSSATENTSVMSSKTDPEEVAKWQATISIRVSDGLIANGPNGTVAVYDPITRKGYYEEINLGK